MLYFFEDKQTIINYLFQTLKQTVAGVDLEAIKYEALVNGDEFAILKYANGYHKSVCISCDSGLAMMRDILRVIE